MRTTELIDWSNVEIAAEQMAGNWREFECFAWSRGFDLEDSEKWCIWYTSHRDSGLLCKSNEKEINKRLERFSEGDDPDLVFEAHHHWLVGHVDGASIRVYKADGSITPAFKELCRINVALDRYPILNEQSFSDMEYEVTLENYRNQMWGQRDKLPEGWEGEVYSWFSDNCMDEFIENRDDQGGWAPREKITEALQDLGLMPHFVVDKS